MYLVARSKRFKKSYGRLKRSGHFKDEARKNLEAIIDLLVSGKVLPVHCADHQLKGIFKDYRECHIRGDLLLVYRVDQHDNVLGLSDIGSHSQLFG